MKKLLSRVAAGTAASVAAVAGLSTTVVGASPDYHGYGGGWHNRNKTLTYTDTEVNNFNKIEVDNDIEQDADSGNVYVTNGGNRGGGHWWYKSRTTGQVGNVSSGNASNSSALNTNVSVNNNSSTTSATRMSTPSTTRGSSTFTKTEVNNTNYVDIENDVDQEADSGDVYVSGSSKVGNVSSGSASNSSTASTTVNVTN